MEQEDDMRPAKRFEVGKRYRFRKELRERDGFKVGKYGHDWPTEHDGREIVITEEYLKCGPKHTHNDIGDPVEGICYRPEWCEEVACDLVLCEQCGNEMGDYFGEAYQCGLCGDIVLKAPDCKG